MEVDPNLLIGFALTLTLSVVGVMAKFQRDMATVKTDITWIKGILSGKFPSGVGQ